ncbi:MAG: hypothetical protein WC374_00705 [Phycisphaerae bacterium]|jgi:hypothetical protein
MKIKLIEDLTNSIINSLYRILNLQFFKWFKNALIPYRLFPFLFSRSYLGKWFARLLAKSKFIQRSSSHSRNEHLLKTVTGTKSTWSIFKMAFWPIIFAMIVITLIIVLPIGYNVFASKFNWPKLLLPKIDPDIYGNLMIAIAHISAVILALFFTAISVVTSTAYAKVTNGIRILVANDDINRRYLSLLAHTAAVAIMAFGLHAIGIPDSLLLAAYVILLITICLLAFLTLGIRVFYLFDMATLTVYPFRKIIRALKIVTNSGKYWLYKPLQNHSRIIVEKQLSIFEELVVVGINDNQPQNDTILAIIAYIHRCVTHYVYRKSSIPSESLWFPMKSEFRRWQTTNSSMTELTLQTGVIPSPEQVPDFSFVETRCMDITLRCLQDFLKCRAIDDVISLLFKINNLAKVYSSSFNQYEAIQLVEAVRKPILEYLKETEEMDNPLKHLQIVDVFCVAAIAPILDTSLSLQQPVEELVSTDGPILKLKFRRLYKNIRPRIVLKAAEDLMQRIEFEKLTEGKVVTSPWYIKQIMALSYARFIREIIKNMVQIIEKDFVAPAEELVRANKPLWSGLWLQQGIHACIKAKRQIEDLEKVYLELKKYHVTDIQWHSSGSEIELEKLEKARMKILKLLAEIVPYLCSASIEDTLPDLLGQSRAWIAEELYSMMERKQISGFPELFISYFNASITIQKQFIGVAQKPEKRDYIRAVEDIMIDLMDISGLALLFSELDDTKFYNVIKPAWDLYLDKVSDKKKILELFFDVINSKFSLPIFSPSAMQRQEWSRRFANALADRGIKTDISWGPFDRSEYKPHPNAVIESIRVSFGHISEDPHIYFAALYLSQREEAKDLEIPYIVKQCMDSIQMAKERQKKARDD